MDPTWLSIANEEAMRRRALENQRIAEYLLNILPSPNIEDRRYDFGARLRDYILRTPRLAREYTPIANEVEDELQGQQRSRDEYATGYRPELGEAAAVAFPDRIGRFFGFDPGTNYLINESHGLAKKERQRLEQLGRIMPGGR